MGVLYGDPEADRLGGEPGGVRRGVLFCDASKKLCGTRALTAVMTKKRIVRTENARNRKQLGGKKGHAYLQHQCPQNSKFQHRRFGFERKQFG